jgi:lysozyme
MNIAKLKESIKKFEGLELKPYYCPAKKLSIGYGRNLEDRGITKNEADFLLANDILNIKLELEDKLPIYKKLDDVRKNVLIEMAFNMGVPRLLGFKKTIQHLIPILIMILPQRLLLMMVISAPTGKIIFLSIIKLHLIYLTFLFMNTNLKIYLKF